MKVNQCEKERGENEKVVLNGEVREIRAQENPYGTKKAYVFTFWDFDV